MEGLIFGGAYVRREIWVSKLIGLPYSWTEIYRFCFVLLCIGRLFPSTSPGALIFGGAIKRWEFLRYEFGGGLYLEGLIHGGLIFGILR